MPFHLGVVSSGQGHPAIAKPHKREPDYANVKNSASMKELDARPAAQFAQTLVGEADLLQVGVDQLAELRVSCRVGVNLIALEIGV